MDHIARERPFLHGARNAANVHQDERQLVFSRDFGGARIAPQTGDVVHHLRPRGGCGLGNFRLLRVNGDGNAQLDAESFEDRQDAAQFFFHGNPF